MADITASSHIITTVRHILIFCSDNGSPASHHTPTYVVVQQPMMMQTAAPAMAAPVRVQVQQSVPAAAAVQSPPGIARTNSNEYEVAKELNILKGYPSHPFFSLILSVQVVSLELKNSVLSEKFSSTRTPTAKFGKRCCSAPSGCSNLSSF